MNIVFLDAYSVGNAELTELQSLGVWTAYENTAPAEVVARSLQAN